MQRRCDVVADLPRAARRCPVHWTLWLWPWPLQSYPPHRWTLRPSRPGSAHSLCAEAHLLILCPACVPHVATLPIALPSRQHPTDDAGNRCLVHINMLQHKGLQAVRHKKATGTSTGCMEYLATLGGPPYRQPTAPCADRPLQFPPRLGPILIFGERICTREVRVAIHTCLDLLRQMEQLIHSGVMMHVAMHRGHRATWEA